MANRYIGSYTLRLFGVVGVEGESLQIWDNLVIASIAIVSLYVGASVGKDE